MTSPPERAGLGREEADAASARRLTLLILEGYAYLLLIIGVFAGALALLVWGLLARAPLVGLAALVIGVPLAITTASAIRALFVPFPAPEGVPLVAGAAPLLHALVEDVRRQLQAPRVHRILVGEAFNASVVQVPRAGVFWARNVLVLGYPVLAALSPDGLRAVVAHELAHLSRAHGRRAVWVYRAQQSWVRLMASLRAREATPAHAVWLFRWFAPRFHAQATAVARGQELFADRCAIQTAGGAATAEALIALDVGGAFLDQTFWPDVFDTVEDEAEPPRPFEAMGPAIGKALGAAAGPAMNEVLDRRAGSGSTHPSLRDRLETLGLSAELPAAPVRTAADAFLGPHLRSLAAALDERWQHAHGATWRAQHEAVRTRRRRLAELAALDAPTPEEHFEQGQLAHELEGEDDALPHYRAALDGGHARAALMTGRILLDREDEAGVALIERAMSAEPALVVEGCARLAEFLEGRGRLAEAHGYRLRSTRQTSRDSMAAAERSEVTAVDRFAPHGLSAAELNSVVARLADRGARVQAFLVRKELRYSTGAQLVLAVEARRAGAEELAAWIASEALRSPDVTVVLLDRRNQALRAALEAVAGARIYARTER